jgi:hypothetical protein
VLKGDLSATPLSDVLLALAEQAATGCLHIDDEAGDEALVYFKNGLVYAAYVPGRRPQLGARLISSGALAPEALAEALEAQETELQGWRLGELLVHLGYVERPVVEAFVTEQLREAAFDLSRWPTGRFRFRKNEKTREDVGSHAAVPDLLAEVTRRRSEWENIAGVVHGPAAIPVLSAGGLASAEMTLDQDQWALLCKVDGERSIAQLARDCGFTTFEAGQIVYALVGAGLLDVEETLVEEDPVEIDTDFAPLGAALASVFGTSADDESPAEADSTLSRISSALVVPFTASPEWEAGEDGEAPESEISRLLAAPEPALEEPVLEEPVVEAPLPLRNDLKDDLASLTAAIADLPSLGLGASLEPAFPAAPTEPVAEEPVAEEPAAPAAEDPFGDSLARVSEALSALLGDALPAVAMPEPPQIAEPTPEEIAAAREEEERLERSRAAAAAELAEAHAMAEAARHQRFGSRLRRTKDDGRKEAERLAAEEAARAEAERVEAERLAAEEAAREQAEREAAEAERLAAEEAARVEAERLAAEAAEAERLAAEEAAREQADREAAERAAEEAARAEAEREAAERVAAEEAARVEAERLAAEAAEAARVAAEEAARQEADRLAAEEAAEAEDTAAEPEPQPEPVNAFEVTALLRDLNDIPAAETPDPADTVETIEEYVPEGRPLTPADPEPAYANGSRAGLSETAALLRELTSLGLDDEPSPPAPASAPSAPRQAPAAKEQPKKRKGLFGRG